jgi:tetratricopeptide (TPR) repeat protein
MIEIDEADKNSMHFPLPEFLSNSAGRQVRKLLGRTYLRDNRLEEALEVFLSIYEHDPEDIDVLLVMANLYRASGSAATAKVLYKKVGQLSQNSLMVRKQLEQVNACLSGDYEEPAPFAPEAIARLVERLRVDGQNTRAMDIREAADILDKYIPGNHIPANTFQPADEMQQLMPALIELNVRQARASGQTELAEALQSLHNHLTRQVVEPPKHIQDDAQAT